MRKFLLLSALAVASLAPTLPAQSAPAKRPMTFEDMMAMKRLGETAVSPDGQWLAYSVTTVNLDQNTKTAELWLQKIAGGEPFKVAVTNPSDSGLQFSADGHSVLFLSGREGSQQIWLATFDPATGATGNPKKLTTISTEADNARWSPDGKFVVFTSSVYPDCPALTAADFNTGNACNAGRDKAAAESKVKAQIFTALLYRHWDHFTGPNRSHLFLIDTATGATRDLTPNDPHDVPPFSLGGDGGFSIAPDAKELAFTENPDPVPATSVSAQIYTLDLTNPQAKPVKISTSRGGNFNPAYSPDGKYLAWRSEDRPGYESEKFRLFLYDRAAKTEKNLLPNFDNWVNELAWAPDSKRIYFTSEITGEGPIEAAALNGSILTINDNGTYGDIHPLPDNKTILATRNSSNQPSEVVTTTAPVATQSPKVAMTIPGIEGMTAVVESETVSSVDQLTNLNTELWMQIEGAKLRSFWFTVQDGAKVQGFVIPPPAFDPAKKYPVKFLIHGGPQGAWGDAWSYRWNAELFAANGYVVVMINPRGSTGYGQAFVDGVNGDWGGKPYTDLMTGLDYAEQHFPFIDKSRECALGASYGGYMANWVLGHTDRFKCIVSHDGMFNAESAFGSTEEDWFNIWEFKGHPWDYYGKPGAPADRSSSAGWKPDSENPFRKFSPSMYAKNFKTPTLVIHSQHDYRLDVSEGFQLFDTLQLLGVPSKMLYFPDESHWVLKPQNSQLWYKTVNDWVDQWTAAK